MRPAWYGKHYTSIDKLIDFAESLSAFVHFDHEAPDALYLPFKPIPFIIIPAHYKPLEATWKLAHEIGHLLQHSGPKGKQYWSKEELQAEQWAAGALIPIKRIMEYNNASIDAFIASLSAHYEDLPLIDCPARELAHTIAKIRLETLLQKGS